MPSPSSWTHDYLRKPDGSNIVPTVLHAEKFVFYMPSVGPLRAHSGPAVGPQQGPLPGQTVMWTSINSNILVHFGLCPFKHERQKKIIKNDKSRTCDLSKFPLNFANTLANIFYAHIELSGVAVLSISIDFSVLIALHDRKLPGQKLLSTMVLATKSLLVRPVRLSQLQDMASSWMLAITPAASAHS